MLVLVNFMEAEEEVWAAVMVDTEGLIMGVVACKTKCSKSINKTIWVV